MTDKPKIELERTYSVPPDITFQWLENIVAKIKTIGVPSNSFYGTCDLEDEFQTHATVKSLEDWLEFIQKHWAEISSSWLTLSIDDFDLSFDCDHKEHIARFRIESSSVEDCNSAFSRLEQLLGLEQVKKSKLERFDQHFRVKFRYTTLLNFRQWFEKFINHTSTSKDLIMSGGWYRSGSFFLVLR